MLEYSNHFYTKSSLHLGADAECTLDAEVVAGCGNFVEKRRADDNQDTVLSRLSAYHEQTSPLANWYDELGIFHRIDGDRSIDMISSDILLALEN